MWATLKIGAAGSVLTAMIFSAPFIPATNCTEPEMPQQRISFGLTVRPESPI